MFVLEHQIVHYVFDCFHICWLLCFFDCTNFVLQFCEMFYNVPA